MSIPIVDNIAWYLIRLSGLIQSTFTSIIYEKFRQRFNLKQQIQFISLIMSGNMIFQTDSPDKFPSSMREKLLNQGRLVLLMLVGFSVISSFTK